MLRDSQDTNWETIAGYEVMRSMPRPMSAWRRDPRRSRRAESPAERPGAVSSRSSWLVRLVQRGTSSVAPEDIERIATQTTDTRVTAQQVKDLAIRNQHPKVITADSCYRDKNYSGAFADLENTYGLVRLQNNQKLSQEPLPKPEGSHGASRKHGADFRLTTIERARCERRISLGQQKVGVRVWHNLISSDWPKWWAPWSASSS